MQIKNTSILPEEIILRIFSEFDSVELRKLLELNSEWREMLIKSVEVMRKLPVILMKENWREKLKFLEDYGNFVREIRFEETKMENFEEIVEILSHTPNIEIVNFNNIQVNQTQLENPLMRFFIGKLKKIVINDVENIGILQFIAEHFETNLHSFSMSEIISNSHLSAVIAILQSNNELKHFEITSDLNEIFNPTDEEISKMKLKLSSFKVKSTIIKHSEQFIKFLESQNQLKTVNFESDHIDWRYYELFSSGKFQKLQTLYINADLLASTDCLRKIREMTPNKFVKNLVITGKNRHLNVFENLLKLFPRIKTLTVENLTQFYSDKIRFLPLTHLIISSATCDYLELKTNQLKMKVQLENVVEHSREFYERNIQDFCNFRVNRDKTAQEIL